MKKTLPLLLRLSLLLLSSIFILSVSIVKSQEQSWQYAHAFGGSYGSDLSPYNKAYNLITDDYGNAYIFGTYGPFTEFNDSLLPFFSDGSRGSFIAKYNCAGSVEWFKAISNAEQYSDQGSHMILKDNYLYLMGTTHVDMWYRTWFLDTTINGASLYPPYTYPWQPTSYTYIIKMDTQGNIVDYHLLNLEETGPSKANSLWMNWSEKRGFAIDNDGNYYIPARFSSEYSYKLYCDNTIIIDSVELNIIGDSETGIPYILKFDSDFNFIWYKPFFSHISDTRVGGVVFNISDMYCDSGNDIYMIGYIYKNEQIYSNVFPLDIYFNNQNSIRLDHNKNRVGYILKMSSSGEVLWCRQSQGFCNDPNGGSISNFETLSVDEVSNNIYISGYAQQDTEQFREGGLIVGAILGESDTIKGYFGNSDGFLGFVVNYDMDGNYKRVITPVANSGEISRARLYDNKIYALVGWRLTLEHGSSTYNYAIGNVGLTLCTWDMQGNPLNSVDISSSGNMYLTPQELSINNRGEVVVAGNFDDNLVFGDYSITTTGNPKYMFIAKYGSPCVIEGESSGEFCYGDSYLGRALTYSGDYIFNLSSSVPGIDSVHTLHATVYPRLLTGINDRTVCIGESFTLTANSGYDSYSWSTGSQTNIENLQYNQAGSHIVYVSITDGICNGVDEILISVESCPVYSEVSLSFCYGESYHELILTESGDYQVTIPSVIPEVDSIITLHATVNPAIISGLVGDTVVCINTELLLEAASGYDDYIWSTGSDSNTEILNYTESGEHIVYVTITDNNCTITDTINILSQICNSIENVSDVTINLYPVPAGAVIFIEIPGPYKNMFFDYTIYDISGKIIRSGKAYENEGVGVSELSEGVYFIDIRFGNEMFKGRFVKNGN